MNQFIDQTTGKFKLSPLMKKAFYAAITAMNIDLV